MKAKIGDIVKTRSGNIMEKVIFKGYTFDEILDKVLSRDIKINSKGHSDLHLSKNDHDMFKHPPIEYFNRLKNFRDIHLEVSEIRYGNISKELQNFYDEMNFKLYKPGEIISRMDMEGSYQCMDCGKQLKPIMLNENTISLISYDDIEKITGNRYSQHIDIDKIPVCEAIHVKDKHTYYIKINSEFLIFTDMFRSKELNIDGELSSLLERIEISNKFAELNIGMATMGNTSVEILKNSNGTEILIVECGTVVKGYEYVGSICCDVWRWMCVGSDHTIKCGEDITLELKEGFVDIDHKQYVTVNIKSGLWSIEHYFDIVGNRKDGIYSKLCLIENILY